MRRRLTGATRRRARARPGRGARCRASASGRTSTGSRASSSSAGYVLNDERGVLLEVEGAGRAVERVPRAARPPRRRRWPWSSASSSRRRAVVGRAGFAIARASRGGAADAPVTPDTATCADCLRELFDPADRRYRYPFINCTNCGPRFTIVRGVPYDRPLTTMAGFRDVRRVPARVRGSGRPPLPRPAERLPGVRAAVTLLDRARAAASSTARSATRSARPPARCAAARIVAVKGIGGYHLACRADDEAAVARAARAQAPRGQAVRADGARTSRRAAALVELDEAARELLLVAGAADRARAAAARGARVAPSVAPGRARARRDAALLAAAPPAARRLSATPLVMTSGNVSDEPIAYRDEDALERLAGDRRPVPRPRPPDRDAHRRLGRRGSSAARVGGRCSCAARAATCPRALAAARAAAGRGRCWPAAPS